MYDFHYNTWIKKFPNSTLLFTDTDSLAYEVVGHDLYAGMAGSKDEFDFSEYPKDHFLQSYDNMKVVGKFKDECKGQLMLKFVGFRPKLYSIDYEREAYFECKDGIKKEVDKPTNTSEARIVLGNKVTAKGAKASVAKKLSFNDYEYCLSSISPKRVDIRRIGSDLHRVLCILRRRLDYLPLIPKGGYVMMVFQRMHLDTGKRNCEFLLFMIIYTCVN